MFAEEAIVRRDGAFVVFVPLVRADLFDLDILVPVSHLGVVVFIVRLPVQSVVLDFETILPLVEDLQSILKSKDNESLTAGFFGLAVGLVQQMLKFLDAYLHTTHKGLKLSEKRCNAIFTNQKTLTARGR